MSVRIGLREFGAVWIGRDGGWWHRYTDGGFVESSCKGALAPIESSRDALLMTLGEQPPPGQKICPWCRDADANRMRLVKRSPRGGFRTGPDRQ